MKTTEYLYGCDISSLPSMTEGLEARIAAAMQLLHKLLDTPLVDRDWTRIKDVQDSINHNNKILKGAI